MFLKTQKCKCKMHDIIYKMNIDRKIYTYCNDIHFLSYQENNVCDLCIYNKTPYFHLCLFCFSDNTFNYFEPKQLEFRPSQLFPEDFI